MIFAASPAASPNWPRLVLGGVIGVVIGLALLGVMLMVWWLGFGRHQLQRIERPPDGFEARLAEIAGAPSPSPPLSAPQPVFVFDPEGAIATGRWLREEAPRLAAVGRLAYLLPIEADHPEAQALAAEIDRLARRWSEPPRRPLVLWRDASGLMLCRCDSPHAVALARRALGVGMPAGAEAAPRSPRAPAVVRPSGLPYPTLGPPPPPAPAEAVAAPVEVQPAPGANPAPRLPGDPAARSAAPASPPTASRPRTTRRTDPPEPRRDADSLFF